MRRNYERNRKVKENLNSIISNDYLINGYLIVCFGVHITSTVSSSNK